MRLPQTSADVGRVRTQRKEPFDLWTKRRYAAADLFAKIEAFLDETAAQFADVLITLHVGNRSGRCIRRDRFGSRRRFGKSFGIGPALVLGG